MESLIAMLKHLLVNCNQPVCFLLDSFDDIFYRENIDWIKETFLPNVKFIITVTLSNTNAGHLFIDSLDKVVKHNVEFIDMVCTDEEWSDIMEHGSGEVCATGFDLKLPVSWTVSEDKTLMKAKV